MPIHSFLVSLSPKKSRANKAVKTILPPVTMGYSTLAGRLFAPSNCKKEESPSITLLTAAMTNANQRYRFGRDGAHGSRFVGKHTVQSPIIMVNTAEISI